MGVIRLLLAISVVIFHTGHSFFGAKFNGGALAVQLFFVISGFYMSLILNEKYIREKGTYFLFISNRLLRLYPLYIIVVLISLIFFSVDYFYFDDHKNWVGTFINYNKRLSVFTLCYILLSNLLIVGQDFALFLGIDLNTGTLFLEKNLNSAHTHFSIFMILGQAWTIGLEIMFYLIAPFLVRKNIKIIAIMITISLAIRLFIYFILQMKYDPWTYRFFPAEIIYFLIGNLCYRGYKFLQKYDLKDKNLFPLAIFLWVFIITYGNIFSLLNNVHLYQTIFHIAYIVVFIFLLPFIFILTKKSKVDSQIGELSYPIYLCHSLFLHLNARFEIDNVYFVVVSSVLFSIILNFLFTKKIESYRQKRVAYVRIKKETISK